MRFRAVNTSFPMLNPMGRVTPGARNFSQASIKLMEQTNPAQKNRVPEIIAGDLFIFLKTFFQCFCFWEKDVVFQMNVPVQVFFKIGQLFKSNLVGGAAVFRDLIIIRHL